jgi:DNA-binding NarL/FixJ family response regulator
MTASEIAIRPARVVLADDEGLFRASLRQLLAVPPNVLHDVYGVDVGAGFEVVGEAGSGLDTVQVVRSVNPDLLILDLDMPRMSGLEALCELAASHGTPPTILLAGVIGRTQLLHAVRLGVRGLVLKESPTELLFEAIMHVLTGQYWLGSTLLTDLMESLRPLIQPVAVPGGAALTRREREVIARVVAGCANKDIAREFSVSEETIKHHLTRIFDKVGAANRVELAMLARAYGLVEAVDHRVQDNPQEPVGSDAAAMGHRK